jgi:hypothetical protein
MLLWPYTEITLPSKIHNTNQAVEDNSHHSRIDYFSVFMVLNATYISVHIKEAILKLIKHQKNYCVTRSVLNIPHPEITLYKINTMRLAL